MRQQPEPCILHGQFGCWISVRFRVPIRPGRLHEPSVMHSYVGLRFCRCLILFMAIAGDIIRSATLRILYRIRPLSPMHTDVQCDQTAYLYAACSPPCNGTQFESVACSTTSDRVCVGMDQMESQSFLCRRFRCITECSLEVLQTAFNALTRHVTCSMSRIDCKPIANAVKISCNSSGDSILVECDTNFYVDGAACSRV
jgi:hypothetical protein